MTDPTEPRYTPGPWENHYRAIVTSTTERVATCADQGSEQVNEANACLIAAAPELLTVCKKIAINYSIPELAGTAMMHRLMAAIAKAEGRR